MPPAGDLLSRLDQAGRHLVPFAITLLLMLAAMSPLPLAGWSSVAPPLALISIFYWAIHRPDLLRPSVVFGIGLVQDLLSGTPVGSSALVYVLAYWLLLTQRRFFLGNSFLLLWWGFSIIALGAAVVAWASITFLTARLQDPTPVAIQALMIIAVFPVPAWLLMRLHRAFLS